MRLLMSAAGVVLASPAFAAPADSVTPMTLPGQGGYLQPGNPDRGISMVGPESALVRQRQSTTVMCASRRGHEARCKVGNGRIHLANRISGRCRAGRDWYRVRQFVVVTNNCTAVFQTGG